MRQLSQSLAANLAVLDKMFGTSADYYAKEITIYHCRGSILLFDGMASLDSLWELLLDAASRQAPPQQAGQRCTGPQVFELILHGSAFPAESEPVTDLADLIKRMTAGMAVLLLDGCAKGIAFSVQGLKFRSVDEPSGEGNLRGSREGFADLLRVNLSLLRRLIRTEHLVQEVAQADTEMQTEYAICYCKNRADSAMVIRVRKALAAAKPELLLDSSYFVPWLLPGKARLFTPVSYTERPAVAAAKICEGKIVVLVNGSPSAMVLPALFCENFECLDDYASTAVFSSFLRILKYVSFAPSRSAIFSLISIPMTLMTEKTAMFAESACMNARFAPSVSPRPKRTEATATPPILNSVDSAHTRFTNGIARLTAPSASGPTPLPTNIPSTIVRIKKLRLPIIAGMIYLRRFFLCSVIAKLP